MKPRRYLSPAEETQLAADIRLRESLRTKELMRKYNASRSLVDTVARKSKMLESKIDVNCQDARP